MQFLLSRRQLQWGQSMCGVCAEVTGPHTKETSIFHPGDPEKEISVWWPHIPYFQWRGQGLYSAAQLWRPLIFPSLMLRVFTAPPITTRQRAVFKEKRGTERGQESDFCSDAVVPAHRSPHLVMGACPVPHRCPGNPQVSWEEDWTREESWRMGVKDSCFFKPDPSFSHGFLSPSSQWNNCLSQQILFECWRCARHLGERCLLLGTYTV